jgi:hypothetical protein
MLVGPCTHVWEYNDKRLKLAQLLGQLGIFLTLVFSDGSQSVLDRRVLYFSRQLILLRPRLADNNLEAKPARRVLHAGERVEFGIVGIPGAVT